MDYLRSRIELMSDSRSECDLETNDPATPHAEYVSLIAKGAGIIFVGIVASGGLRYLFQVIVARHVGVELFGLFSLGLAVFNIAQVMTSQGMGQGVVRYVALYEGKGDRGRVRGTVYFAAALSLGGSIVASLLLVALSKVLAANVFHAPGLTNVLRFFAIAIPFSALTTVFLSSTQALRIMRYKVYVRDLFELLSRIALVILIFLLGWKLWGAIFALVISVIAGTFLSFFFYRKAFHPIPGDSVRPIFEPRGFLAFCWPLFLANGFYLLETWMSTFMLGYFATPKAVGVFSAAYRTSLLVQGILLSFATMFAPIISDLHRRRENKELESLFKTVAKWVFSLSLPALLLMAIFSREIMAIFGSDFAVGATSLIVLSLGQLMNSVSGPLGVMIDMSGRSKITLLNSVLHLLLQIGLCFLLIPRYGIMGAAVANAISVSFQRAIRLVQVHLILRMHPFRVEFFKPLVAGGASWLVLSLIRTSSILQIGNSALFLVLVGSSIFLAVYGLTLYQLGFDEEDKVILQKIRIRLAF
jgi:O-antigen/teichoic acid export membrane protein